MESGTKSKRPLGITILTIWFVIEGFYYFYNNSMNGVFGSQDVVNLFRGSFAENSLAAYGFGLAISHFFIAWYFMERKYWIRIPTIIVFIITTGISWCLVFLGYITIFQIIIITSLAAIVIIYLMKSNAKKYFAQLPSSSSSSSSSYSSTPV